jgi:hypothetical protein
MTDRPDKINLRLYNQLNQDDRIDAILADYVAYDPYTGAYLRSSRGRRKFGKPTRYYAVGYRITVRFTAYSDEEAVEKANRKLNAEYDKQINYKVEMCDQNGWL